MPVFKQNRCRYIAQMCRTYSSHGIKKYSVRRSIVKCPNKNPTASWANYRYIHSSTMHQNASLTVWKLWLTYKVAMAFWINIYVCQPYPRHGHLSVNQLKNQSYC